MDNRHLQEIVIDSLRVSLSASDASPGDIKAATDRLLKDLAIHERAVTDLKFIPFPKIPRLRRQTIVTEKLDGTNAAIVIRALDDDDEDHAPPPQDYEVVVNREYPAGVISRFAVRAQSRKRIITPDGDNFGFARWVHDNAADLVRGLGKGAHFGEWWGNGIQRGYGVEEKYFSLFNVRRWGVNDGSQLMEYVRHPGDNGVIANVVRTVPGLYEIGVRAVPVLAYLDTLDTTEIEVCASNLRHSGSIAAPGFDRPEGVIIYHVPSGHTYKRLLENDELPKGLANV